MLWAVYEKFFDFSICRDEASTQQADSSIRLKREVQQGGGHFTTSFTSSWNWNGFKWQQIKNCVKLMRFLAVKNVQDKCFTFFINMVLSRNRRKCMICSWVVQNKNTIFRNCFVKLKSNTLRGAGTSAMDKHNQIKMCLLNHANWKQFVISRVTLVWPAKENVYAS